MGYTRNAFEYLEESAKRLPDKVAFADAERKMVLEFAPLKIIG